VSVTVASVSEAVVVPAAAVQTNDDQTMVTVLRDGRQERRVIELGVKGDSTVQVTNGLTEGDRVMLRGVTTSGNTGRGGTGGGFPGSGPGGGGFPGGGAGRVPGGN
jgi:macrolide-specific efflux system membrane fusion protein